MDCVAAPFRCFFRISRAILISVSNVPRAFVVRIHFKIAVIVVVMFAFRRFIGTSLIVPKVESRHWFGTIKAQYLSAAPQARYEILLHLIARYAAIDSAIMCLDFGNIGRLTKPPRTL